MNSVDFVVRDPEGRIQFGVTHQRIIFRVQVSIGVTNVVDETPIF